MHRLSQLGSPETISAMITTMIFLKSKFGMIGIASTIIHDKLTGNRMNIKIAGHDITAIDVVPAEGGEPAYLDIVGQ